MLSNLELKRRSLLPKCLLLTVVVLLVFGGPLFGQPKTRPGGGTPTGSAPVTPPPPPPDGDENALLPWLLAGGAIVAIIVTAIVIYKLQRKVRDNSTGPRETIVPDVNVVLNDYRFKTHLATGQSSQVWEVVDVHGGMHYAMKVLLHDKVSDSRMREALFHEAEVGQELAHPNIVRILKVSRNKYNPHFVMEFFPSGSLKLKIMQKKWDFIKEHGHSILKQAATALAYMNAKGWVHRDVKPDNFLVNLSGEVRLIDFALAQSIGKGRLFAKKGQCQGTRSYMSPEQIRCQALDGRADIYSFGAAAYELATGRPPFRSGDAKDLLRKHLSEKPVSPIAHNPEITQEFADLVLRMLAKRKEERPESFHEVLMRLKNIRIFKVQKAPVVPSSGA
jgi:eukaryotic-like serine/threonine-protein kinase